MASNFEKLIEAWASEAVPLETALQALLRQRDVWHAIGAQLDVVGAKVGQPRNGLGDEDYRRWILARIAANRSSGTIPQLIKIVRAALTPSPDDIDPGDPGRVEIESQFGNLATGAIDSALVVRMLERTLTDAERESLIYFLRLGKAAGVRLVLESLSDTEADTFTLANSAFLGAPTAPGATEFFMSFSSMPLYGSLTVDWGLSTQETRSYTPNLGGGPSFTVTPGFTHAHAVLASIVQSDGPGKGLGDTADPNIGGKFVDARV